MAQLVKLLDYVSRYENDLSRYPTQYIRLKKYQWERMKINGKMERILADGNRKSRKNRMSRKREDGFPLFSGCSGNGKTVIEEMGIPIDG